MDSAQEPLWPLRLELLTQLPLVLGARLLYQCRVFLETTVTIPYLARLHLLVVAVVEPTLVLPARQGKTAALVAADRILETVVLAQQELEIRLAQALRKAIMAARDRQAIPQVAAVGGLLKLVRQHQVTMAAEKAVTEQRLLFLVVALLTLAAAAAALKIVVQAQEGRAAAALAPLAPLALQVALPTQAVAVAAQEILLIIQI